MIMFLCLCCGVSGWREATALARKALEDLAEDNAVRIHTQTDYEYSLITTQHLLPWPHACL